jgi:hypothetical protein
MQLLDHPRISVGHDLLPWRQLTLRLQDTPAQLGPDLEVWVNGLSFTFSHRRLLSRFEKLIQGSVFKWVESVEDLIQEGLIGVNFLIQPFRIQTGRGHLSYHLPAAFQVIGLRLSPVGLPTFPATKLLYVTRLDENLGALWTAHDGARFAFRQLFPRARSHLR